MNVPVRWWLNVLLLIGLGSSVIVLGVDNGSGATPEVKPLK